MSKDHDKAARKPRYGSQIVVWGLLGLLIVALSGFGITDFGGGSNAIGKVGTREISATRYANALDQALSNLSERTGTKITLSQAREFGIDQQVLRRIVAQTALEGEAQRIGISVGDAQLRAAIQAIPAFQDINRAFSPTNYSLALDRAQIDSTSFEDDLRADLAGSILAQAVAGGMQTPALLTNTLYNWFNEQRDIAFLVLDPSTLPQADPPSEADLVRFYQENIALFTSPQARRIIYIALQPDDIIGDQPPVDEASLRALYEARLDEFIQPEARFVERLIYPDIAAATQARTQLDSGRASFEELVFARGLELSDIDLGDVVASDLSTEAGAAVFAANTIGVIGPIESAFGPALFRISTILPEQKTSFEAARLELTNELQSEAAKRDIASRQEAIDDLLASGAILEEVALAQDMQLVTLNFVPNTLISEENIGADQAFYEAASTATEDDFPEPILLENGGIAALRFEGLIPAAPRPLEEARTDVLRLWEDSRTERALKERADQIIEGITNKKQTLQSFGTPLIRNALTRTNLIEGAPEALITQVFEMEKGDTKAITVSGFTAIAQVLAIRASVALNDVSTRPEYEQITQSLTQTLIQDTLTLFNNALAEEAGISLNQNAINAVRARQN